MGVLVHFMKCCHHQDSLLVGLEDGDRSIHAQHIHRKRRRDYNLTQVSQAVNHTDEEAWNAIHKHTTLALTPALPLSLSILVLSGMTIGTFNQSRGRAAGLAILGARTARAANLVRRTGDRTQRALES
jgi:hypothetical protein